MGDRKKKDDENAARDQRIWPSITTTTSEFSKKHNLSIMSLNARSINNKFQKIRDAVHNIDPGILCIQETWGQNEGTDYSIKGYHKPVFKVRPSTNMNAGGGEGLQYG